MKTVSKLMCALICGLALVTTVAADHPRDAGSKARGEIYNFWVGESSQRHAQDHARSLHYYGQTQPIVTSAPAQQHVAAVRQNLESCQKAVGELKKSNPENKEVQAAVTKIGQVHAKVLSQCDQLDKTLSKEKCEGMALCNCCVDMCAALDGADVEMGSLMKALKIEKLEPLSKAAKPATPEKK